MRGTDQVGRVTGLLRGSILKSLTMTALRLPVTIAAQSSHTQEDQEHQAC